ncbi:MAG: 50S ribosomal protein L15 [Armatimonadetes bacterium]|nr:50S ribosomal protein L15 [Armatimonadota bacterium]
MRLHDLKPAPGSRKKPKRVGRGIGSGHGKTSTRGHKGQHARNTVPPRFEGGQTPLHRRLPVRVGFRNVNRKEYAIVNVSTLSKRFNAGDEITPETLKKMRIVRKLLDGIKILGNGEIDKALKVSAHAFTGSAEEKIKAAGGEAIRL